MKKACLFLAAGCLALSISAAENIPVGVKVGKTHVYQPQKFAFAQAAEIHTFLSTSLIISRPISRMRFTSTTQMVRLVCISRSI